jgi:hypothetical protein
MKKLFYFLSILFFNISIFAPEEGNDVIDLTEGNAPYKKTKEELAREKEDQENEERRAKKQARMLNEAGSYLNDWKPANLPGNCFIDSKGPAGRESKTSFGFKGTTQNPIISQHSGVHVNPWDSGNPKTSNNKTRRIFKMKLGYNIFEAILRKR